MKSEFEKWLGDVWLSDAEWDESKNTYSDSRIHCMWSAWQHQQSKVDELTKQRDSFIEAAKFKKMGVKAGVPDLQLLVPNGLIHGLWIELKSKTGKLQPSQRLMMQRLEEQGYLCKVCFGADEAINEIKKYLCLSGGE